LTPHEQHNLDHYGQVDIPALKTVAEFGETEPVHPEPKKKYGPATGQQLYRLNLLGLIPQGQPLLKTEAHELLKKAREDGQWEPSR
jgi:hypothetical protein